MILAQLLDQQEMQKAKKKCFRLPSIKELHKCHVILIHYIHIKWGFFNQISKKKKIRKIDKFMHQYYLKFEIDPFSISRDMNICCK